MERYANPGATGSSAAAGQNNGPTGSYVDNKASSSSPMDTSSGDAATPGAGGTKCVNNEGGAASTAAAGKDSMGKKSKGHNEDSVSFSKSSDASSSPPSGAQPSSTNINSNINNSHSNNSSKARDGNKASSSLNCGSSGRGPEYSAFNVQQQQQQQISSAVGSLLPLGDSVLVKKEFGGGAMARSFGNSGSSNSSVLMKSSIGKCSKNKVAISDNSLGINVSGGGGGGGGEFIKMEKDANN